MASREKALLGFRPLHPAVRYFCQLCGQETAADEAISRRGRTELMSEDRDHLFCKVCAPEIDRICNTLAGEEIRLQQESKAKIEATLREIAAHELELLGKERLHGGEGSSAPPSDERTSPRSPRRRAPKKRQGMIPNPNA